MSATTSIPTQQTQQKPGFRKIMTWNRASKKLPHLSYDSAPGDEKTSPVPASPTHSLRSLKSGRPSLFATFARRNSTKSDSSRSRSPTSPRPSNDLIFASDGIRTPSPTPSRNSMIFERDIEFHDHLSVHEAIDLAIPPVLDDAAEAFLNEETPATPTEKNNEPENEPKSDNGNEKTSEDGEDGEGGEGGEGSSKQEVNSENLRVNPLVENDGRKRLSLLINYGDNNGRTSPSPFDHTYTLAETIRVTTPRELNGLTGLFDNSGK